MRRQRSIIAVLAIAALVACGGGDKGTAPVPTVVGSWAGSFPISTTQNATLSFVLTQTGGAVSGTGQIASGTTTIPLTITGTFAAPSLALTMNATGYSSSSFAGTVSGTSMTGTLNGSGFSNQAVTLTRP